jgi:hypothetical protein
MCPLKYIGCVYCLIYQKYVFSRQVFIDNKHTLISWNYAKNEKGLLNVLAILKLKYDIHTVDVWMPGTWILAIQLLGQNLFSNLK